MRPASALALLTTLLAGCGEESVPCDPSTEACSLDHGFGAYTIAAGGEIDGVCMSWTLDNPTELWVNNVAIDNDGFFHHSNWFFVPDNRWELPDGHWSCNDNEFTEIAATIFGGVLYAQSTQTKVEEQRFRPGAAVRIPPYSRIIAATHILNTSDLAVDTEMRVRIDTIAKSEVTAPLAPFRLTYSDLAIPPQSVAEFTGTCDLGPTYERITGKPLELKLHYLLPHYHSIGSRFRFAISGGERDGDVLFDLRDAYGEPLGKTFEPPIDIASTGATRVSFTCGYDNPRDVEVGWGIGDQEMCVALGFAETDIAFQGTVDATMDVTTDSDGVVQASGPCSVNGLPAHEG